MGTGRWARVGTQEPWWGHHQSQGSASLQNPLSHRSGTPQAPLRPGAAGLERGEPRCRTWGEVSLPQCHIPLSFFLLLLLSCSFNSIIPGSCQSRWTRVPRVLSPQHELGHIHAAETRHGPTTLRSPHRHMGAANSILTPQHQLKAEGN